MDVGAGGGGVSPREDGGGALVPTELEGAVLSRVVAAEATRDPDRPVLVFENGPRPAETVTAADLVVGGDQLAAVLAGAGLLPGDRMAIMLGNHPEFVYALVANAKLGLTTVPIDPRSRGGQLELFLRGAGCAGLLTADYLVADGEVAAAVRASGVWTWVVSTPEGREMGLDVSTRWDVVNDAFAGPEAPDPGEHVVDLTSPWLLARTDGAATEPATVQLGYDRMPLYRLMPGFLGYRPDDVLYTGQSLTHINALVASCLPALWGSVHQTVLSRWFTERRVWELCARFGATTWTSLGGAAAAVYRQPSSESDRHHGVRLVVSAGMPRQIWRAFEERFGVRVLEWYGTMAGGFACNPVGVGPIGSFGKPPDGLVEMEVVDTEGQPLPPHRVGELIVRPAGGSWLRTGDLATRDEHGWLYLAREEVDLASPPPGLLGASVVF